MLLHFERSYFLLLVLLILASKVSAIEPVKLIEPVDKGPVWTNEDRAKLPPLPKALAPGLHHRRGCRTLFQVPNDPFFIKQWYFHNVGQPDEKGQIGIPGADISLYPALSVFAPQREVVLAIVDSGLDLVHEDVSTEILWTNQGEIGTDENGEDKSENGVDDDGNGYIDDIHGWNFVKDDNYVQERHYHGTHVNGLLSAVANNEVGLAGGFQPIKIMLIKIFGLGATANRDQIAKGIRYAADNGASVVSCSFGSMYSNENIKSAIAYCDEKGILVCCAAGNSRKSLDVEFDYPSCYDQPNQVIVSATDNRDLPSIFANFGSIVDIAAPGTNIFSLMPKSKYRSMSGTSQACPMVAAAACLLMAQEPSLTHMEVKERLIKTANKHTALKRWVTSAGRLDVYNLLTNRPGKPLPEEPEGQWIEREYALESKHPYAYDSNEHFVIEVPEAKFIRIHFKRFEVDKYSDYVEIAQEDGTVIEKINSPLGEIWTEPIPGSVVKLYLYSNHIVNAWGFQIDKLEYIAK